ncbi:hypothetical protein [Streptomyces himastatinicus]|nr:hypothetical protein [Streptomyces himastatinicus]
MSTSQPQTPYVRTSFDVRASRSAHNGRESVRILSTRARMAIVTPVIVAAGLVGSTTATAATTTDGGDPAPTQIPISDPTAADIQVQNFESSLSGVLPGFESRRWSDDDYTQIRFTGCVATTGSPSSDGKSTHVELFVDEFGPDPALGEKKYTQCFESSGSTSNGEWSHSNGGDRYFSITKIDGSGTNPYMKLFVKKVLVDTTKAD